MGQEEGLKAEQFFMSTLNAKGIPFTFVDDWYDFEVNKHKVEVKSCRLFIHDWKRNKQLYGRYKFTNKENRENQKLENVWICLILRHKSQHMFQGFVRAKDLDAGAHVSIRKALLTNPLTLDEWITKILRVK